MTNIETVQEIYAAFGRGDVPAILDHLAEDVEWDYAVGKVDVPWLRPRRGRAEVPGFFHALGALEFTRFEPKTFLEGGDVVVVLLDVGITVRETGQRLAEEDEVHIWRFDPRGRVTRFTHKLDTHAHRTALRGEAV